MDLKANMEISNQIRMQVGWLTFGTFIKHLSKHNFQSISKTTSYHLLLSQHLAPTHINIKKNLFTLPRASRRKDVPTVFPTTGSKLSR